MHCIGSAEGQEQVGHIPGRGDGRGELCTAERAGRCLMGPLADAGEVAACVVACRTGEGHGAEVLGANDALGWSFWSGLIMVILDEPLGGTVLIVFPEAVDDVGSILVSSLRLLAKLVEDACSLFEHTIRLDEAPSRKLFLQGLELVLEGREAVLVTKSRGVSLDAMDSGK